MDDRTPKEKPFSSWKEIAAYLGCDERTCLRWEKQYGLPVHRIGEGPKKSLVFAYKDELDAWLRRRKEKAAPGREAHSSGRRRISLPLVFALGLPAVALLVLLGFWMFRGKLPTSGLSQPYDFRIERSEFIALNKKGAELWRYDTGLDGLHDDSTYRAHFRSRRMSEASIRAMPWLKIDDVNQDGRHEVLFSVMTVNEGPQSQLICFDHQGRPLWVYYPGREMKFGQKIYSADYTLAGVDILDEGQSKPKKVLVIANQRPRFPTYLALLSPQGKLLGEYWNSGRFSDYVLSDIDQDGNSALVLAGTNNEYGKGFLVVLDPDNVWGGSPQSGEFKCPDLKPGSELFYVLFPRTEVDRLEFGPREAMASVDILNKGRLMVMAAGSRIFYEFNTRMRLDSVIISDAFREKYRKYQAEGKIPSGPLDEEALASALAQGVVYYDGERWTTTHSRNKNNIDIYLQKELR